VDMLEITVLKNLSYRLVSVVLMLSVVNFSFVTDNVAEYTRGLP